MLRLSLNLLLLPALFSLPACAGQKNKHLNKTPQSVSKVKDKQNILSKDLAIDEAKISVNTSIKPDLGKTFPKKKLPNHYQINPNQIIKVDMASSGYSRFSIKGERITDVFVYPQESITLKIHDQGYLIVVPERDKLEQTGWARIYLTLTGEQGTTQDIYLRFRGGNPSPITFIKSQTIKTIREKLS